MLESSVLEYILHYKFFLNAGVYRRLQVSNGSSCLNDAYSGNILHRKIFKNTVVHRRLQNAST
jgi:hypothetical protein